MTSTLPIAQRQATTIVNNTWIVFEQVLYLFSKVTSVCFSNARSRKYRCVFTNVGSKSYNKKKVVRNKEILKYSEMKNLIKYRNEVFVLCSFRPITE